MLLTRRPASLGRPKLPYCDGIGGWDIPDLRGSDASVSTWISEKLAPFLTSGRNAHDAVTGEMSLVVAELLRHLTGEDVSAIVAYLGHIGRAGGGKSEEGIPPENSLRIPTIVGAKRGDTTEFLACADPAMPLGTRLFLDNCSACHFIDGKGANEMFPVLDGNSTIMSETGTALIETILNGAQLPSITRRPMPVEMPGFAGRLSDEEVRKIANFVRSA